ncbi:13120_t:CDS:2, partial [Acaulospora colombiana]
MSIALDAAVELLVKSTKPSNKRSSSESATDTVILNTPDMSRSDSREFKFVLSMVCPFVSSSSKSWETSVRKQSSLTNNSTAA